MWAGYSRRYSDWLRAGRPGDRIPVAARLFALAQNGPESHPAHSKMGPGGKRLLGRDADPSPPSSAVGQERVELYLYFPYGPYGLYIASMPVQYSYTSTPPMGRTACTEPQCLYSRAIPLLPLWAVRPVQSHSACTVELYIYSPYGPYGLYRATVPVH
jgi:hypothetical protein